MPHFWQQVTHFDRAEINPRIALRNSIAVAIPLALGVAWGRTAPGIIMATGALNVAYSDGTDPYFYRARRMAAVSILAAMAVVGGGIAAGHAGLSVVLAAACAFAAGMLRAVDQTAGDIGIATLVTLIVFSAQGMTPLGALQSGALTLGGGLLQMAFALALWPVQGHAPERRVLAAFYGALARAASAPAAATEAPPASQESTQAQDELALLRGNPSVEAERHLALLSQAERIRVALLALARLRVRIGREAAGAPHQEALDRCLGVASRVLASVAQSLLAGQPGNPHPEYFAELDALAESVREAAGTAPTADLASLLRDARWQVEALAGQLRSAVEFTAQIVPSGAAAFARSESAQPRALRLTGWWAVLRANLTLESAAFRHAIRLAVCVATGEGLAHAVDWQRSYWLPMTVAIVLKPDFTGTFSRGLLRLLGTFFGLACATAMFHVFLPPSDVQVALLFLLTFVMRALGPANYGLFCTALSALIVLLIALTGVPPAQVIAARGVTTFVGGAIALLAYALWPTWEHALIPEALARMLEAYRGYFDAVRDSYLYPEKPARAALDRARLAARLARSNLEASSTRLHNEPGVSPARLTTLDAILANSHRFIHAAMSLESGLARGRDVNARPAFIRFAADVDTTVDLLAADLRGARIAGDLPDLREDHRQLLRSGGSRTDRYELVNIETDRITNSLNTLAGEVREWINTTES
jgi:uncharacterized membrane protein YccC